MRVELKNLDAISPYERNPRLNDDAVEAVAASIREFGFRQPIVVDGRGVILCGHTRWKAAKKLGLEKVPVHVAKDLTTDQAQAYRLADNHLADLSEWDPALLATLEGTISIEEASLAKMLDDLIAAAKSQLELRSKAPAVKELKARPLPKLAWVLIGIPIGQYGALSNLVETAAAREDVFLETTVSDGPED